MFQKEKIYSRDEIFQLKKSGCKVFELNYNANNKTTAFDRYKVIQLIGDLAEIESTNSILTWQGGAIIVEMIVPNNK